MITRNAKGGKVQHAEVRLGERRFRLTAMLTPDGWLAHSHEVGTKDSEHQGQWPDPESAVGQLEWYARHALNVTDPISWSDEPIS